MPFRSTFNSRHFEAPFCLPLVHRPGVALVQAYGNMRRTFGESASVAMIALPSLLFRPAAFFVRMCRENEWRRLTLPVAVILKRFAAPLWVFSFMTFCFRAPSRHRLWSEYRD